MSDAKDKLRRLRDAIVGRGKREVTVDPDGQVRETLRDSPSRGGDRGKPTKLAPRTFGLAELSLNTIWKAADEETRTRAAQQGRFRELSDARRQPRKET